MIRLCSNPIGNRNRIGIIAKLELPSFPEVRENNYQ